MACLPIPTSAVTVIISNVTERMSPAIPKAKAPFPTTASQATNGKTAAAVQSTEAAPVSYTHLTLPTTPYV